MPSFVEKYFHLDRGEEVPFKEEKFIYKFKQIGPKKNICVFTVTCQKSLGYLFNC
jgi:hypothetical protein